MSFCFCMAIGTMDIGPGSPSIPLDKNGPVFYFDNSNAGEYVSPRAAPLSFIPR